ncbi:MAG: DUF4153 domain-containing protein [Gemmatimonadota bacterium]
MQSKSYDKEDNALRTTAAARAGFGSAILLGIAAERLLIHGPFGWGWVLWIALFGASAVLVVRQGGFPWLRETALASGIAVCAAIVAALRDSEALHMLSVLVLIAAASIPLLRARALRFGSTPVAAQLFGLAAVVLHAMAGVLAFVTRDASRALLPKRVTRIPLPLVRGMLLAVPPVVVFGALFVSADALFESYVRSVFSFASEDLAAHAVIAFGFAWIGAGLLRSLLPQKSPLEILPAVPVVSTIEVVLPVAAVTTLFAAFVGVQARWLFDGSGALAATAGLTAADHARRGFFELVFASALVLPLLLLADGASRDVPANTRRALRALSGILVVLVFLVLGSAFQRMTVYTDRFGLTEDRLYATAFMGWLGVVFVWFMITTLRGRRRRFAAGPIAAGIAAVFALAAANPDALIARVNLQRAREGAALDAAYLSRLSADGVPELIRHFHALPADAQCHLSRRWVREYGKANQDWRVANRAQQHAEALIARSFTVISETARECERARAAS